MGRSCRRTVRPAPSARSAAGPAPRPSSSGSAWRRHQRGSRSLVDLLDIRERRSMYQAEDRVRDQSEDADRDHGGDDAIRSKKPLRDQDETADAALGRDDFGDDQVSPGPAHRDSKRIEDFRKGYGRE